MKVMYKITFGFLAVVLLGWAVAYHAFSTSQRELKESCVKSSEALALKVLDEIDRDIHNKIRIFQKFAAEPALREVVSRSNREFEAMGDIRSYISKKDEEWTALPKGVTSRFMRELMNNRLSRDLREKLRFYEAKHGYRVFGEVFVTNRYGANIAQTGRTTDYRQDDEEWWQSARTEGLYVKDVEYDESAGVYSVTVAVRIDDAGGEFTGVMKAVLNIEDSIQMIRDLKAGARGGRRTMQYSLLTRDGRVIYSTKGYSRFEDLSHLLPDTGRSAAGHESYLIMDEGSREGREIAVHAHSRGYSDYGGLGWILVVEQDVEEMFAPAYALRNRILAFSLVVSVLAALVGFFLYRSVLRPIKRLKSATAAFERGELDIGFEEGTGDEIGEFTRTLARALTRLKEKSLSHEAESSRSRQTEDALRESEERFHTVSSITQDAVVMIDHNGRITFWNEAAERMFGYARGEVIGKELHSILAPGRYHEEFQRGFERFRTSGEGPVVERVVEVYAVKKGGEEFPIELSVSAVKRAGGWCAVGIMRDISERKETERSLSERLEELERFRKATVQREFRMKELKEELRTLRRRIKEMERHDSGERLRKA